MKIDDWDEELNSNRHKNLILVNFPGFLELPKGTHVESNQHLMTLVEALMMLGVPFEDLIFKWNWDKIYHNIIFFTILHSCVIVETSVSCVW